MEAVQLHAEVGLVPLLDRADQVLHLQHQRALAEGDLSEPLGHPVQPCALVPEARLLGRADLRHLLGVRPPSVLQPDGALGQPLEPSGVPVLGGGDAPPELVTAGRSLGPDLVRP